MGTQKAFLGALGGPGEGEEGAEKRCQDAKRAGFLRILSRPLPSHGEECERARRIPRPRSAVGVSYPGELRQVINRMGKGRLQGEMSPLLLGDLPERCEASCSSFSYCIVLRAVPCSPAPALLSPGPAVRSSKAMAFS